MADNSDKEFREVVKALNDEMNNSNDLNFDVTLAACLGFKNKYMVKIFIHHSDVNAMISCLFSLSRCK